MEKTICRILLVENDTVCSCVEYAGVMTKNFFYGLLCNSMLNAPRRIKICCDDLLPLGSIRTPPIPLDSPTLKGISGYCIKPIQHLVVNALEGFNNAKICTDAPFPSTIFTIITQFRSEIIQLPYFKLSKTKETT